MNPAPSSRHADDSENEQTLRIYRSLALTGAVVVPGFGIVRRIIDPATGDPLWERIAIAVLMLLFAALTVRDGPVRRHPHLAIAGLIYVVSGVVVHMAMVNGLTVNTSYGLLIMLFACSLAFRTRRMLAGYLIVATLGIGATMLLAPMVDVDPVFFTAAVIAVSLLTYAVQADGMAVETALREARDMAEAAVDARGRFLANMSHEIRTPMNGVIGMASLLERTSLTDTQREYLQTIRSSGDTLLLIINDILDFSKIEAGHVLIESEPFEPLDCLEGSLDVVMEMARAKGLELVGECAPDVPATLLGDSLRLRQILVNLLSNAVKFTPSGEVHVRLIGEPEDDDGYRLHGEVRDTGIGVDPDQAAALFEAFTQADSSTTRRFGGTGLGLSICRQLVERMDGSIELDARGPGTTFRFDVRLARRPLGVVVRTPDLNLARVLLFEPQATARAALARQLEALGIVTEEAATPAEAREALGDGELDAVLAGCGVDELQALEALAGSRGSQAAFIRVAPMTEWPAADADQDDGFQTLQRPVKRAQLLRALQFRAGRPVKPRPAPAGRLPTASCAGADATREAGASGLRILLAEDNAVNQQVVVKMLERLGYRIDLATNGAEALAAARGQPYDLVLMDVQMPVMDGLDATRRIRRDCQGRPHIVAMTANALREDREACLAAGMDDYLSKPLRMDDLQALLMRLEAPQVDGIIIGG